MLLTEQPLLHVRWNLQGGGRALGPDSRPMPPQEGDTDAAHEAEASEPADASPAAAGDEGDLDALLGDVGEVAPPAAIAPPDGAQAPGASTSAATADAAAAEDAEAELDALLAM